MVMGLRSARNDVNCSCAHALIHRGTCEQHLKALDAAAVCGTRDDIEDGVRVVDV